MSVLKARLGSARRSVLQRRGHLLTMLLVTLCFAPLLMGMSSARRFESGPRSNPTASRVTFSERVSSTREFNSYVYDELEGRWSGDGMSRLVLYTWRENSGGVAVNSLHENDLDDSGWIFEYTDEKYYFDDGEVSGAEGWLEDDYAADESEWDAAFAEASTVQPMSSPGTPVYLAYDIPWVIDIFKRLGDKDRVVRVPRPCIRRNGGEYCGSWQRVRNVDLGRCSIELPYANRGVLTPAILVKAKLRNFSLGDTVLKGLLAEISGSYQLWNGVKFVRVTFRERTGESRWYVSERNDELCMVGRLNMDQPTVLGLGFFPVSKMCRNRPVTLEVCGKIELASVGVPVWETSTVAFSQDGSRCAKLVVGGIEDYISELLGDPNRNPITSAIQEAISKSFTFSARELAEEEPALSLFVKDTCDNPSAFPGSPSSKCFIGLVDGIPGRCVSTENGAGECRTPAPIVRIESTPAGVELVIADHRTAPESAVDDNWLMALFEDLDEWSKVFNRDLSNVGILGDLRANNCIVGASADQRDIKASSRFSERLLRGNVTTIVGGEQ